MSKDMANLGLGRRLGG